MNYRFYFYKKTTLYDIDAEHGKAEEIKQSFIYAKNVLFSYPPLFL